MPKHTLFVSRIAQTVYSDPRFIQRTANKGKLLNRAENLSNKWSVKNRDFVLGEENIHVTGWLAKDSCMKEKVILKEAKKLAAKNSKEKIMEDLQNLCKKHIEHSALRNVPGESSIIILAKALAMKLSGK